MSFRSIILFLFSALSLFLPSHVAAQEAVLLNYIQHKSDIKEGGTGLFRFDENTYLITVVSLSVGSKTEQNCKVVGSGKAKRDMLAYVNGSVISSYTQLITSENIYDLPSGKTCHLEQRFVESIKETVFGTINEIRPLGGWYSEDKAIYFFAIYKTIQ